MPKVPRWAFWGSLFRGMLPEYHRGQRGVGARMHGKWGQLRMVQKKTAAVAVNAAQMLTRDRDLLPPDAL